MPFLFSTALSGLQASSDALNVTGNNIANANTTAFKSQSASFADVFNNSLGVRLNGADQSVQIGSGVVLTGTDTNFTQGSLSTSGSPTNAAIQGNGFFVVQDATNGLSYTRAGDFTLDHSGYLVTPTGQNVQGYAAVNGQIPPGSPLTAIKLPIGEAMPPVATTQATLRLNLDSTAAANSQFHAPVQVYDSKGVAHTLDMTFTQQANGSYLMSAMLDGNAAQANGSANPVAFTFDANGQLTAPATLSITPNQAQLNGASLPSININLFQTNPDGTQGPSNLTNYASASTVSSTDQDGFAPGTLTGLSISSDSNSNGTILGTFTNGQTRKLGQMAVALFNSPAGLRQLGGNLYGQTVGSGQPSIGVAGTGGRGQVVGGELEQSNVDITSELTNLIVSQRSFQANSRVITSIDQILQDIIQNV